MYQFYFPYVLPRAADWDGRGVLFRAGELSIRIRPRRDDEPLFPNDVDKTLANMTVTLTRLPLPGSETKTVVRDECHDRLEALVQGEVSSVDEAREADVQAKFELRAIEAANQFLAHCRAVAGSPFVLGVQRRFRIEDQQHHVLNPRTIAWFDGDSGERLPVFADNVNATATSGAIASPERGEASMAAVQASLARGPLPDLVQALLLDAEEALVTLRIREALVAIGTSAEIASDQYIERLKGWGNRQVCQTLKRSDLSFAARRYDRVPAILSRRSFATYAPDSFSDLERMYRARNSVAHTGRTVLQEGGREAEVDTVIATHLLVATRKAVDWIAAL